MTPVSGAAYGLHMNPAALAEIRSLEGDRADLFFHDQNPGMVAWLGQQGAARTGQRLILQSGTGEERPFYRFSVQQRPTLQVRTLDSTRYVVQVRGMREDFPLVFGDSFHPAWKLYLHGPDAEVGAAPWSPLGEFALEPYPEQLHWTANGFANAWWLDREQIQADPQARCTPEGGCDFDLLLTFTYQRLLLIGLGISGVVVGGSLLYLGWALLRSLRRPRAA